MNTHPAWVSAAEEFGMDIEEYAARAMQSLILLPETRNWASDQIAEEAFRIAAAMCRCEDRYILEAVEQAKHAAMADVETEGSA